MRRDREEVLRELVTRIERFREERRRRALMGLTGLTMSLVALLVVVVKAAVMIHPASAPMTAYGAYLLPGEAGGYVLTAVVAFVLGAVTILACMRLQGGDFPYERDLALRRGGLVEGVDKDKNHE